MIEATDAPVTGDPKPTNDSNLILPGSTLTMNTPYKFMSNDRSGGIRVAFNAGNYVASLTNNTSFVASPVSVLKFLISHLYPGIVIQY
jgi:hypothetical protein